MSGHSPDLLRPTPRPRQYRNIEAVPAAVSRFRAALQPSDAILISSPEYAHGVSGVLKNALDWAVSSGELIDKPIASINASARGDSCARVALRDAHDHVWTRDQGRINHDSTRWNRLGCRRQPQRRVPVDFVDVGDRGPRPRLASATRVVTAFLLREAAGIFVSRAGISDVEGERHVQI